MVEPSYDKWYETHGEHLQEEIEAWFDSSPSCICVSELLVGEIDDFISETLMYEYEVYISDIHDHEYERWKDENID